MQKSLMESVHRSARRMDHLRLPCLGRFIGALVAFGLQFVDKISTQQSLLATIIAAGFTGGVIAFVDRFRHLPAIGPALQKPSPSAESRLVLQTHSPSCGSADYGIFR